jgi:hypothetical protein
MVKVNIAFVNMCTLNLPDDLDHPVKTFNVFHIDDRVKNKELANDC